MKAITAIVKPFKLEDVKNALKEAGVAGLTVPVPNANGPSYLAVTISTITPRLSETRAAELLPALKDKASEVAAVVSGQH